MRMSNDGIVEIKKLSREIMKHKDVSFAESVRLACIFYNKGILSGNEELEEKIKNVKNHLW